jgi:SAM-dependent methyltransferase
MEKDNINLQASEEVSYDSFIKGKKLVRNRERFYIKQLCKVIDDVKESAGRQDISVLEIGFDNGSRFRELVKLYPDIKFTGLEVREKPVEDMRKQGYDCRVTDTEMFDEFFGAVGMFDVIYGIAVVHHMDDPYKSLESIIRLLKPGGVLLFIREDHPYDVVAHFHTTISKNWAYEKNKFIMNLTRFRNLLGHYSNDYYVKYDNNGIMPCFRRGNKVFTKLRLNRVPLWNSFTIYARIDSRENQEMGDSNETK